MQTELLVLIYKIPEGCSEGMYEGRKYGIRKRLFNSSRSQKVFAKELGGNDFISFNLYQTASKSLLKPCEMPEEKVIDFLKKVDIKKVNL